MTGLAHDGGSAGRRWLAAMPAVFVLIWSTGFVVARYGMPHAPPMSFLVLRFGFSAACLALWALLARASWPASRAQWGHLAVTGLLMQAGYLGCVWAAVRGGIGAGTVALVVGLQPVLTTLWVARRGAAMGAATGAHEGIGARHWVGLLLGLVGLVIVVAPKLQHGEVTPLNLGLAITALLSITAGTLYQKRHVQPCDVRSAGLVQMLAALLVSLPVAALETAPIDWHPEMLGALAWSVLVLTLGGSSLLYLLIQRGAATRVTSLMYLVPPCTALMAWALFGEPLHLSLGLGIGLTVCGVLLVARGGRA